MRRAFASQARRVADRSRVMGKCSSSTGVASGMWGCAMLRARLCGFLVDAAANTRSTRFSILTALRVIRSGSPGPTPTPYNVPTLLFMTYPLIADWVYSSYGSYRTYFHLS